MDDAAEPNGIVDDPCEGKVEVDTKEEGFINDHEPDSVDEVPVYVQVDVVALDLLGLSMFMVSSMDQQSHQDWHT